MQVLLGNADPVLPDGETRDAPCVTYVNIPSGPEHYPTGHHGYVQAKDGLKGDDLMLHVARAQLRDGITNLPGHEPVLVVAHPDGAWRAHSKAGTSPLWVASDDAEVQRILSEFYRCPAGLPNNVEDTHFTHGGAPGVGPSLIAPGADFKLEAAITQNGRDIQARNAFGFQVGAAGAGTAATATTLTTALTTGSTTQYTGQRVFVYSTTGTLIVWGNIISCTSGASAVLTVDRWYNAATPGGAAATTPTTPWGFIIADGGAPAWFMGLSASVSSVGGPPGTNTSLPSEITTASGGLVRQICPWAHTASAATTTLTPVFTANGSDSLPVTIGSIGVFSSMVVADVTSTMYFNTLLGTTATLSASGDSLTLTETITGS